jgi:hypothetical protein
MFGPEVDPKSHTWSMSVLPEPGPPQDLEIHHGPKLKL